ncbi:MAG TPA: diguanylate cyclase [Anaerolineales bacterium]|nr:diguanylate cyclase [Anaerolineales bacterium]
MSQVFSRFQQIEKLSLQILAAQREIDDLNHLAWKLRIGQKERSYELCTQAIALASTGEFELVPYRLGQAASLATMAIVNADCGKPDQAISQCIEALSLLKDLPPVPALSDVWIAMAWIHIYLGNYPAALDYGIKALNLARELGDLHREAWALDAVASSDGASGDAESSIAMHNQSVAIFREVGDAEGQARTLNNMACTLLEVGQLDEALQASLESLQLARQTEMQAEVVIFAGTVGDILIEKGDYHRAEEYIRIGLEASSETGNQLVSIYQQIVLGRLYLAGNRLDEAEASLRAALKMAEAKEMADSQAQCHQLLSEVAERQNDLLAALKHYKQFHRLKAITTGEETSRRLAILKVTHQSESAIRDAEIYRLHNLELQREIEERKRMESLLHNMAMFDPLTNLYNRRQFYNLAKLEIERAKLNGQPVSVLMIDVDHFKRINDQHGHLNGDRVLITVASSIQSMLRENDIIGRYGGEEFVVLLPETMASRAYEVGEGIRCGIRDLQIETSNGLVSVTLSIGVTDLMSGVADAGSELDLLLGRADQALYCAKHSGRNVTHLLDDGDIHEG